jgi:hypothetical protein
MLIPRTAKRPVSLVWRVGVHADPRGGVAAGVVASGGVTAIRSRGRRMRVAASWGVRWESVRLVDLRGFDFVE